MVRNAPPHLIKPAIWVAEFTLYCIVIGLLAFAVSGCGALGVATTDDLNERVDALNEARIETAEKMVAPLEPIAPGITAYAGDIARGVVVRAPPVPDTSFPWLEIVSIVGAAVGVSVPAAVRATNVIRDGKRRAMGEATSVPEAKALGQVA